MLITESHTSLNIRGTLCAESDQPNTQGIHLPKFNAAVPVPRRVIHHNRDVDVSVRGSNYSDRSGYNVRDASSSSASRISDLFFAED